MRCPDCNKFVGLETQDAEVGSIDITDEGDIRCDVRVSRLCSECSQELKEYTFDFDDSLPEEVIKAHNKKGCSFEIEEDGASVDESGGSRYKANVFTCSLDFSVTCACQKKDAEPIYTGSLSAECRASDFEEMV